MIYWVDKERVLSGIKPSGKLHIGNYLGALQNFVKLQDEYEGFFAVVDLHSLTEKFDPKTKGQEIIDTMIDFLAVGLDPEKSTLFIQSHVPQHTELAWIFSCLTPVAELERMTQYKDFITRGHPANAGLFTYPILQAADILLYKPKAVPVGEDQLQHLELTNDIARKFNNRFGETFPKVRPLLTRAPRVMSLSDPAKKMSKSEPAGCIFLSDEPSVIEKKLARAVTDKGTEKQMSIGTKNLFSLLEIFGEPQQYEFYLEQRKAGTVRYADMKKNLAKVISHHFSDYRKRRKELEQNPEYLKEVISNGAARAHRAAGQILSEVKQKIGLIA